jgi:hypothetical protein
MRTVDNPVASILGRLGLGTRARLGAWLAAHRLLPEAGS